MFAVIAAVIAILAAFGVKFGSVDMLFLFLCFLALHLAFSWSPWDAYITRRNP